MGPWFLLVTRITHSLRSREGGRAVRHYLVHQLIPSHPSFRLASLTVQFSDAPYTQLSSSLKDTGHHGHRSTAHFSSGRETQSCIDSLRLGDVAADRSSAKRNSTVGVRGHGKARGRCGLIRAPYFVQGSVPAVTQQKNQNCFCALQSLDGSRPPAALAGCHLLFPRDRMTISRWLFGAPPQKSLRGEV